jgi:hypothetical protein
VMNKVMQRHVEPHNATVRVFAFMPPMSIDRQPARCSGTGYTFRHGRGGVRGVQSPNVDYSHFWPCDAEAMDMVQWRAIQPLLVHVISSYEVENTR